MQKWVFFLFFLILNIKFFRIDGNEVFDELTSRICLFLPLYGNYLKENCFEKIQEINEELNNDKKLKVIIFIPDNFPKNNFCDPSAIPNWYFLLKLCIVGKWPKNQEEILKLSNFDN